MNPRAKLFLAIAAGGGLAVFALSRKKDAQAAELPEVDEEPEPPLLATPQPVGPGFPIPSPSPGLQVPLPPFPGDLAPAVPLPVPEEPDERDDLEPVVPPFVPPPIDNVLRPAPAPAPPVQPLPPLPPAILPPELVRELPGIVPTPVVGPGVPIVPPRPVPLPSLPPAEQPTVLPDDTAQVLGVMLGRESTADWKRTEPLLKLWQQTRGMTADGKFGPGTALAMAQETGLLPIVRFWPRGSLIETGAVDDYRTELFRIAQTAEEPRKAQLFAAAEREQGQGFGRNPQPISPLISL